MLGLQERDPPLLSVRRKLILAIACMLAFVLYVGATCHPLFIESIENLTRAQSALIDQATVRVEKTPVSWGPYPRTGGSTPTTEKTTRGALNSTWPPSGNQTRGVLPKLGRGVAHPPRGAGNIAVKWAFNSSDVFSGMLFGAGREGGPTICDVDGDGRNEILYGTSRGDSKRLWCVGDDGSLEWVFPPVTENGLPGDPSRVSLVDVDNDGVYELCFAGRSAKLFVLNGHGTIKWVWDNPETEPYAGIMHGAPQAFDVDGDGFVEFFMNSNGGYIYRVDHNGKQVWRSFRAGRDNQGHPTIADVDRDGRYEVLWASQDHKVYCIDAERARLEWKVDVGSNMKRQPPIVADVNGDGEYEVIVWSDAYMLRSGSVHCLTFYGRSLWNWSLPEPGNIRMCQALGDVDGDGHLELVLNSDVGGYALDVSGSEPVVKWHVNFTELGSKVAGLNGLANNAYSSYQLIADFDGDGVEEVLWLSPFPVVVDGRTGQVEAYYRNDYIAVNRRAEDGGWWGDVDRDGKSEWIADLNGNTHSQSMLYCMTLGGSFLADAWWPEFSHCAYPGEYQKSCSWLKLKAAYSNSLWFPMEEFTQLPWVNTLFFIFTSACIFLRRSTHGPVEQIASEPAPSYE